MIHWLTSLFQRIAGVLNSDKAKAVEAQLASLVEAAQPIVEAIAQLTPNRTVAEITKAYEVYGLPLAQQVTGDPTSTGNALLNLATAVLQKNHAPTAAVSLLNTAVQLAVTATKLK